MKSILKNIKKNALIQKIAGWIISSYLSIVFRTIRWDKGSVFAEYPENEKWIVVFWHGQMAFCPFVWRHITRKKRRGFFMLISGHPDGKIISHAIKNLGINTIEGSASKDGSSAFRKMLREISNGNVIGITPDGPRGPFEQINNDGVFMLSLLSGACVIPIGYTVSNYIRLKTWDKFMLPLPFGKGKFISCPPIAAPKDKDQKAAFLECVKKSIPK